MSAPAAREPHHGPARYIESKLVSEPERGTLAAFEGEALPFVPARFFVVFGVPAGSIRGDHAHRRCHELLIATRGRIEVSADDGATRGDFVLDTPSVGLYLPPRTWCTQHSHSPDAVLAVLASHPYDPDDYIRDFDAIRAPDRYGAASGPGK
jgi:UDP-2-acetamido-3-amino-2,3-dideoxy-glucuronate N-acetyltransferase